MHAPVICESEKNPMAAFPSLRAVRPEVGRSHGATLLLGVAVLLLVSGQAPSATPTERESTPALKSPASRGPGAMEQARRATPSAAQRRQGDSAVVTAHGVVPVGGKKGRNAGGGVVQAGAFAAVDCSHCGRRGCNHCRPAGGRIGLHCNGKCDAGGCPAHCPVRPDQFGYYATRWRSWPGQGVRQVGHFDPATTPAVPPRSQLPTMDEESGFDENDRDEDATEDEDADGPAVAPPAAAVVPDAMGETDAPTTDVAPKRSDDAVAEPAPAETEGSGVAPGTGSDDPLDRLLEKPKATDGAAMATPLRRGVRPPASFTGESPRANPLRTASNGPARSGEEEHLSAAYVGGETPAAPARSAAAGWRPLERRPSRDDGAAASLRGVSVNPGNPLR